MNGPLKGSEEFAIRHKAQIDMLQRLGFEHRLEGGEHIVTGHGFSKRHVSLGCIAMRIAEYLKKMNSPA